MKMVSFSLTNGLRRLDPMHQHTSNNGIILYFTSHSEQSLNPANPVRGSTNLQQKGPYTFLFSFKKTIPSEKCIALGKIMGHATMIDFCP